MQNEKIINRLNRNKNSCHPNKSLLDSSMTDLLTSTQKSSSYSDTPQFPTTRKRTSVTDISNNPQVNIGNIFDELTTAKFRKLIFTEPGNNIKDIVQNEIKEQLKNETIKVDKSVGNSYLIEINVLTEEVNKKEVLVK